MKTKVLPKYAQIDEAATCANLKSRISASGYRVSEILDYLCLSCPQPIYRWMQGKALPSLQHMFALSCLLGVSVDELLIRREDSFVLLYYMDMDYSTSRSQVFNKYLLAFQDGLSRHPGRRCMNSANCRHKM